MKINENIRAARIASGLTQEQVAEKLHTTRQTVSSYETGRTQADIETLCALAELFSVPVNTLLYGDRDARRRKKLRVAATVVMIVSLTYWFAMGAFQCLTNVFLPFTVENWEKYFAVEELRVQLMNGFVMPFAVAVIVLLYFDLTLPGARIFRYEAALTAIFIGGMFVSAFGWAYLDPVFKEAPITLLSYTFDYIYPGPQRCMEIVILAFITRTAVHTVRRIRARKTAAQNDVPEK